MENLAMSKLDSICYYEVASKAQIYFNAKSCDV